MRFALKPTIVILLVFKSLLSAAQLKLQPSLAIGVGFRGGVIRLTDKSVIPINYGFNYIFGRATNYLTVDLQQKILNDKLILQISNYFVYTIFDKLYQFKMLPYMIMTVDLKETTLSSY